MTTVPENNQSQDEELLAQLYKKGAKETPSAKINCEIIKHAKNTERTAPTPSHIGSHFGGGWKVPLSLAASVVVVFALLIQLDQTSQQLELPPIPEIYIPSESKSLEDVYSAEERISDDTSSFKQDIKEPDLDSQDRADPNVDGSRINQSAEQEIQPIANRKAEQQIYRERTNQKTLQGGMLEKAKPSDDIHFQDKSKPNEANTPKLNKPSSAKKQIDKAIDDPVDSISETVPTNAAQPRPINGESKHKESASSRKETLGTSGVTTDNKLENETEEFAPIPIEDWLLMIEKLVARKDYAEAARQLEKFKQAHPKVNVEDLDAKIP